jgi:peptide/nickel transport system substrate-binding protein
MRKIGVVVGTLVAFLVLSSVAHAQPAGRIVIAQPSDPTTFDAHVFSDQPTYNVLLNIYETLVERGADMQLRPLLAESYRIINDRTWQFKLRRNIKFTNGEAFNAAVVKWNVERMIDPATKSKNSGRVSAIERVDIVDDFTVNIVTKMPYPILDAQLSRVVHMMPPQYVTEKGSAYVGANPIGTGPYKFVRWVKDDELVFEANEAYWRGAPRIKTVVFRPIPEPATRVTALLTGEVDLITQLPPPMVDTVTAAGDRGVELRKVLSLEVMFMPLYNEVAPTTSKKVRQAINYGVNVEAILQKVMNGAGERRAGILARQAFGFDASVKPYPYNPELAKQLLKEAGYSPQTEMLVSIPSGRWPNEKEIGEAVVGDLQKIGMNARARILEWGTFLSNLTAHKLGPMHLQGWGPATLDADDLYSTNLYSKAPFSQFRDERLDRLIEEGRSTMDKGRRLQIYQEIARFQAEEATHLFLWQSMNLYGVNKRVSWTPRPDEYLKMYDASVR